MFDTPILGQFLSDFVRVKSNFPPRPSTFTYPIFEKSDFLPNYPFKNKKRVTWIWFDNDKNDTSVRVTELKKDGEFPIFPFTSYYNITIMKTSIFILVSKRPRRVWMKEYTA